MLRQREIKKQPRSARLPGQWLEVTYVQAAGGREARKTMR